MKKSISRIFVLLTVGLYISTFTAFAQAPAIQWQKCYGGSNADFAKSIEITSDDGYIIAGYSWGEVEEPNHGLIDFLVVKINSTGNLMWKKYYGGSNTDRAHAIRQTTDGGYIVAGYTRSNDGDVSGLHGTLDDFWIVKLDDTGAIQWQKCLGGTLQEEANDIQQTADGGYIVVGKAHSSNGDVSGMKGLGDMWIVKLNNTGNIQWQKCLGGSSLDIANAVQQTTDSGYIIAGYTYSNDGDVTGPVGFFDGWIVKLSSIGAIQWQKRLGGAHADILSSIKQTSNGGYIAAGVQQNHSGVNPRVWVVRLNNVGNLQWQKTYGGSSGDAAYSIQQTNDGGFSLLGASTSIDGDVSGHHGAYGVADYWLVRLDSSGNLKWEKSLGGTGDDDGQSVKITPDGGFILAGSTMSIDGDVTGKAGNSDFWVVKLALDPLAVSGISLSKEEFKIYPNPATNELHIKLSEGRFSQVSISDVSGKVLFTTTLNGVSHMINTSVFPIGLYFIRVQTENEVMIRKFVKE
ncbi:MAG TPA: T9SS type A sorting domain-containing protein [Flavipsychrobacter sp.]|nr:T9SS type A sorting domain-containing protein [Flavipsychrobacter sp.]